MKSLRNFLSAICLSASIFFSPFQSFADKETIFNQTYSVPMTYEFGEETEEKIRVQASLDSEKNILYFGTYTQDYNRRNWIGDKKQKFPIPNRHTIINYNQSRIFILHPQRAKISETQQRAFIVPQYKWISELEPYEEREGVQLLVEAGDKIVDKILSKIPFLGKAFDKFIKDSKEKEKEYYEAIFEKIDEDYTAIQIPPYIPKSLIGYSETAREYTIEFDTGNTQDEIPMFLWIKIALGDPSNAAYGSFPNKYGELENILIKFNLNEDKIKREELYPYFFHGRELMHLNIAKKNIEGTKSNPAIITINNLEYDERQLYEEDRVVRIGMAEYILQGIGDSADKDLSLNIIQFETNKDRENFMENKRGEIKYPSFFKESIFSFIDKPTIGDVLNPIGKFNEEQLSIYFDLILDYTNRTGMQIMLSENEQEGKELLEGIKEHQINSEEE